MPPVNRAQVAAEISEKLKGLTRDPNVPLLPWTHKIPENNVVSCEESEEYHQRRGLYEQADPDYGLGFGRPMTKTAEAIWDLLRPSFPKGTDVFSLMPGHTKKNWFKENPKDPAYAELATKQAFCIVLATFVSAGLNRRMIILNDVFDALAVQFSDHFHSVPAETAWDMTEETVGQSGRDLLLNGISLKRLWKFVLGKAGIRKKKKEEKEDTEEKKKFWKCPLFSLKPVKQRGYQVFFRKHSGNEENEELEEFDTLLRKDTGFHLHGGRRWRLLPADRDAPERRDEHELCADNVRYNVVPLSPRSEKLLQVQEAARLLFDAKAFREDYDRADREEQALRQKILETYRLDPRTSNAPTPIYGKPMKRRDEKKFEKLRRIYEPAGGRHITVRQERESWSPRDRELFCRAIEKGLGEREKLNDGAIEAAAQKALQKERKKWDWHCAMYQEWYEEEYETKAPEVSVEEVVRAANLTKAWRAEVRNLLPRYDRALSIVVQYDDVYEQAKRFWSTLDDLLLELKPVLRRRRTKKRLRHAEIRAGFYRTLNRRYQPTHVWPTFVTSKNPKPGEVSVVPESQNASYRKRWFKVRDPQGLACDLVGYDVSSSQTQILAILLGLDELHERMLREGKSIKMILAEQAWQKDADSNDLFELWKGEKPYRDLHDKRLRELVGNLWMRVLYGSPISLVADDQRNDRERYGPGWNAESASLLLESQPYYPALKEFLAACRRVAEVAHDRDRCAGVVFRDIFDGAVFRWNPVERRVQYVRNEGQRISANVPGGYELSIKERGLVFESATPRKRADGTEDYPVDLPVLSKMLAPCLVHMLDAAFSSLVMEKLAERGVRDFVGIHDCWLVPEKVRVGDAVKDGRTVLKKAIDEASGPWFDALGSVYEDLNGYLAEDPEFGVWIASLKARWEERRSKGEPPKFLIRES